MNKQIFVLATGLALLTTAQNSGAGLVPAGSVNYQVVLNAGCVVNAFGGGAINLGNQPSYDGDKLVPGIVTVGITCANMTYGICVSGGANSDGNTRRLKDTATPANYLNYDLIDASNDTPVGDKDCNAFASIGADTAPWADPFGGPVPGISGSGEEQNFSLNAFVTIPSNSPAGVYSDNGVILTIVW